MRQLLNIFDASIAANKRSKGVGIDHHLDDDGDEAFITDHELPISIEEVRMARRDERVIGKGQLTVAANDVLLGLKMERKPVHAFSTNQDQLGPGGVLHVPEKERLSAQYFRRNSIPTTAAELVPHGHAARTRAANVVTSLFHQLLLRQRSEIARRSLAARFRLDRGLGRRTFVTGLGRPVGCGFLLRLRRFDRAHRHHGPRGRSPKWLGGFRPTHRATSILYRDMPWCPIQVDPRAGAQCLAALRAL